ncbi:MAG: hypothetical protein JXQ87_17880 [Bacteroidia bacterium]
MTILQQIRQLFGYPNTPDDGNGLIEHSTSKEKNLTTRQKVFRVGLTVVIGLILAILPKWISLGYIGQLLYMIIWLILLLIIVVTFGSEILLNKRIVKESPLLIAFAVSYVLPGLLMQVNTSVKNSNKKERADKLIVAIKNYKKLNKHYPLDLDDLNDSELTKGFMYDYDTVKMNFELEYFNSSNNIMIYQKDGTWHEWTD